MLTKESIQKAAISLDCNYRLLHNQVVSQSNTIFQGIIDAHYPALNARKPMTLADELRAELAALPALEDDDEEEGGCEHCGCGETELADDSDPSVGYYNRIIVCAGCGKEIE